MEEQQRKQKFERQLELKRKLEIAKFEAEERRKTREVKDEAARLAAEAETLQKEEHRVANDPEAIPNRLLDFDFDSVDMVLSSDAGKPVVHQPFPGVVSGAQIVCGDVLSARNTSCADTSSPLFL